MAGTDWPGISIVTPSYNQAEFIRDTIESVLGQDYPRLEYIIIDGGSSDGSVEIIREYADRLAYWVSEKDAGQSDAINKGFAVASGDVVSWLNSDDMLFPGALRRIGRAFALRPWADLVTGESFYVDRSGRVAGYASPPFPRFWNWRDGHMRIPQPATFYRREAVRRAGGLRRDLHFAMDCDIWREIMSNGGGGHVVYHPVAFFRLTGEGKQADADGRREEEERVWNEYGVTKGRAISAYCRMQMLRIFDGSYFRSRWKAFLFRGKTASQIWAERTGRALTRSTGDGKES